MKKTIIVVSLLSSMLFPIAKEASYFKFSFILNKEDLFCKYLKNGENSSISKIEEKK